MARNFFEVVNDVRRALRAAGPGGLTATEAAQKASLTYREAIQALAELWGRRQADPQPGDNGSPAVWRARVRRRRTAGAGEVQS